jgi:hypothetical protein
MRKSRRRLVIPLAVFALVAAAGIAGGLTLVAHAQTEITECPSEGTPISCSITSASADTTVLDPSTIQAFVTLTSSSTPTATPTSTSSASTASDYIQLQYSMECFNSEGNVSSTSQAASPGDEYEITSEVTATLSLGFTNPASCEVLSLTGTLETSSDGATFTPATTGSFTMELEWTSAATSSSSSSSSSVDVAYISGYGGKCLDDRGNSSSNGAQVIIWGCNHGDSAQSWSWSGYELKHNGKCVNDPAYGGSGSKLILWSCNGGSNEKWSHVSGGEFKLFYSSKGHLCLDDPGYSTTNGTRLSVYTCNNGGNQHWSRS